MTLDQTDIGQLIGVDVNERLLVGGGHKGLWGTHTAFAHQLKEEIRRELGFTVNIGVSDSKLLAKMLLNSKSRTRSTPCLPGR